MENRKITIMDGKRINSRFYAYDPLDNLSDIDRKKLKVMWKYAEATTKPKDIRLYRDGSRWGVSFYGKPRIGFPIIFGTGGNDKIGKELESLFYNPTQYNIIPFNNTWNENQYIQKWK
jgi:hypothetical protein